MKRNQVKMTTDKVLTEINRELSMRARVFPKWVDEGKIQQITAAERYVALLEVKDILVLMKQKGVDFDELKALLTSIIAKPIAEQQRMNFGSTPKNPV